MFIPTKDQLAQMNALLTNCVGLLDYLEQLLPENEKIEPEFAQVVRDIVLDIARRPDLYPRCARLIIRVRGLKSDVPALVSTELAPTDYQLQLLQFFKEPDTHYLLIDVIANILQDKSDIEFVYSQYLQFLLQDIAKTPALTERAMQMLCDIYGRGMNTTLNVVHFINHLAPSHPILPLAAKEAINPNHKLMLKP